MLAIALEDIKFDQLNPKTGRADAQGQVQTAKLPEATDYVMQLALAEDHVIACVLDDEGYEVLWMWQGGEEVPSVKLTPP